MKRVEEDEEDEEGRRGSKRLKRPEVSGSLCVRSWFVVLCSLVVVLGLDIYWLGGKAIGKE
ncbi:MAG: hypothetical protein ACT4OZ_03715 [Gemmatimonadota bacterium]